MRAIQVYMDSEFRDLNVKGNDIQFKLRNSGAFSCQARIQKRLLYYVLQRIREFNNSLIPCYTTPNRGEGNLTIPFS